LDLRGAESECSRERRDRVPASRRSDGDRRRCRDPRVGVRDQRDQTGAHRPGHRRARGPRCGRPLGRRHLARQQAQPETRALDDLPALELGQQRDAHAHRRRRVFEDRLERRPVLRDDERRVRREHQIAHRGRGEPRIAGAEQAERRPAQGGLPGRGRRGRIRLDVGPRHREQALARARLERVVVLVLLERDPRVGTGVSERVELAAPGDRDQEEQRLVARRELHDTVPVLREAHARSIESALQHLDHLRLDGRTARLRRIVTRRQALLDRQDPGMEHEVGLGDQAVERLRAHHDVRVRRGSADQ
jgi:hypothetical protein